MTRMKNQGIYSIKRKRTASKRKVDIEDPYHGNRKGAWKCKICGSEMKPYKQDKYGDIIVHCTNPNCVKSGNFNINTKLKKLLKQQQMNSQLYYTRYDGGYY